MKYIILLLLITSTCTLAQSWGDWNNDQWLNIELMQKLHRLDNSSLYASWDGEKQSNTTSPLKALSELEQWDFDLWLLSLDAQDEAVRDLETDIEPILQEPTEPPPVQPPSVPGAIEQERLLILHSV